MNRRLRQLATSAVVAFAAAVVIPFHMLTSFAGSAKIAFTDPSATVGQEFNVSVKITATEGELGTADLVLSYDPSYIEFVSGSNANGGAGSIRLVGTADSDATTVFSYSLKFKAIQAGNSAISVSSYEVYDKETQTVDVTKVGSSAIKVAAPSTYSKEAGLTSLKVSPGTLTPAFSSDVTSYTVNVGAEVDRIAISASAKDSKAKVLVSGDSNLKIGENTVVCKVTAEDGQTVKSYKITVNKSQTAGTEAVAADSSAVQGVVTGELTTNIDGTAYSVAISFDAAALPQGYAQSTVSYGGTEVMCGTGNGLTLIYLQDASGKGGFFIYDKTSGAVSPYVTLEVSAKSIVILPIDDTIEVPSGLVQTTIQLKDSYKVNGWVWQSDAEQKYCVVYGMNESGEKGLYRYDKTEYTFQRYFEDPAVPSKYDEAAVDELYNQYEILRKDYNVRFIIMVALIVVSLILFFIIINLLMKKKEATPPPRPRSSEPGSGRGRQNGDGDDRRRGSVNGRSDRADKAEQYDRERMEQEDFKERVPDKKPVLDVYQTRSNVQNRAVRPTTPHPADNRERTRDYQGYVIRHEEDYSDNRRRTSSNDYFKEEKTDFMRKEREREERARMARERLERERREDDLRRTASRGYSEPVRRNRRDEEDDFEFMDLN